MVGFGGLLRRRRLAAGLTQVDLAARAGVGVRTVRDLERGRSSRPQRTTVELLAGAIGLVGRDRADFFAAARGPVLPPGAGAPDGGAIATSVPDPVASDGWPSLTRGLPAPGHLIGRDGDVTEVADLVVGGHASVVSLVGLAGAGKTRLALAVAQRIADQHPGPTAGIVVAELSTVGDVLTAVAAVFGAGRAAELATRLADAPALLLVDAVERAPEAVAEALHQLAAAMPRLRVLATGRHPIGLAGERVWPVTPLEVPPADVEPQLEVVAGYPAAALFLARLRQVRRDPLDPAEVSALVRLVRRLGGLPLALELAAARGRVLDLNEILDRYGDRMLDLAAPSTTRQAVAVTLRDAVAASYRLLAPDERSALRRLSVFRNRWSVELAEGMLSGGPDPAGPFDSDPVPLLDRLMALGLLNARGTGPFRFRLLDVVRDFAAERAAAKGELTAVRRRHAVIFAGLAARIAPELTGADLTAAVGRLDEVSSDLGAALAHSATDDPHTALCLASSLPRWWRFRGRDVTGRQWLRRLLDDPRTADADPAVRAWAQVGVAQLAVEHGAGPQELPAARSALAEFQRLGDVTGELATHAVLGVLWSAAGGYAEAQRHGEAMLELAGRENRVRDMMVAQHNLTWHEMRRGELRAARRRLAAVDRLAAQCGEERLRALVRANLAELVRLDGRYGDAVIRGRRVLGALTELGDPGHRRGLLGTIGLALAQDGRLTEAAEVLAELRAQAGSGGAGPDGADDAVCAAVEATIALRRGEREVAAEWFAVAAEAHRGGHDPRDVVEALVGLVASTEDPTLRRSALDRLAAVCQQGAITLLPRERALIGSADLGVPTQRRRSGGVDSRR